MQSRQPLCLQSAVTPNHMCIFLIKWLFLKCVIGDTQVDIIMNLEMKNGFFYQHVTELSGGQFTFNQLKGDFLKLEVNLL